MKRNTGMRVVDRMRQRAEIAKQNARFAEELQNEIIAEAKREAEAWVDIALEIAGWKRARTHIYNGRGFDVMRTWEKGRTIIIGPGPAK